jgi:hypothetical protein
MLESDREAVSRIVRPLGPDGVADHSRIEEKPHATLIDRDCRSSFCNTSFRGGAA